ncbi:MAG: response regulator [Methylococcales bacterium]|nr:response regulator [Methylococcales bacterium]
MVKEIKALVIDDELAVLESFKMILGIKNYTVKTARSLEEAVSAVSKEHFDIAFIDLRFEGRQIGLDILKKLKEIDPKIEAVIVTAYATEATKIDAIQLGAMDYISKPFMMEVIYELVDRAIEKNKAKR